MTIKLAINKQILKYTVLKSFCFGFAANRDPIQWVAYAHTEKALFPFQKQRFLPGYGCCIPQRAPQPEGEGTQPSHSATKTGGDTHRAMHSSLSQLTVTHWGLFIHVWTVKKLCFTVFTGSVSHLLLLSVSLLFALCPVPTESSQTTISSGSIQGISVQSEFTHVYDYTVSVCVCVSVREDGSEQDGLMNAGRSGDRFNS